MSLEAASEQEKKASAASMRTMPRSGRSRGMVGSFIETIGYLRSYPMQYPSKDEPRVDEVGFVLGHNGVQQLLVGFCLLGGDHGADRERAQGIGDGQRSLG
jgi:hypothetical protein